MMTTDDAESAGSATGPSLTCTQILTPPVCQITTGPYRGRSTEGNPNHSSPAAPGAQGEQLQFTPRQPAWECTFSPDGILLAVAYGAPDPVVRIFGYHDGLWSLQSTLSGMHEKTIRSVAFAPLKTTRILAAASFDGTVSIWEPEEQFNGGSLDTMAMTTTTRQQEWISSAQLEGHETEVKCVRWNATGSLLATCGRDKSAWIWECYLPGTVGGNMVADEQFECLAILNGHEGDVKCVRFAPSHGAWGDGEEILLSASYDDTIKCWAEDAGDWYCVATIQGVHSSTIWSLTCSPSGTRLVAGSEDGAISIYKGYYTTEEKQQLAVMRGDGSDEDGNDNGDKAVLHCVGKLDAVHSGTSCYSLHYAPAAVGHGRIASGGGDNRIIILREVAESRSDQPLFSAEVAVTTEHGDVNCVAWHPANGSVLASTGDDGNVRLWNFQI